MATTTFASLKLIAAKKPAHIAPVQIRRNKLSKQLWLQIQAAKGVLSNTPFTTIKHRTVTNTETGEKRAVEQAKAVKQWWFVTDNGKLALNIKYGARALVLNGKGMTAIEVASANELVNVLEAVKTAVEAGELDAAIESASGDLRKGFGK